MGSLAYVLRVHRTAPGSVLATPAGVLDPGLSHGATGQARGRKSRSLGPSRCRSRFLDPHSLARRGGHALLHALRGASPDYGAAPGMGHEATVVHWVQNGEQPPAWAEVHRRLQGEGRRSRGQSSDGGAAPVRNPGATQALIGAAVLAPARKLGTRPSASLIEDRRCGQRGRSFRSIARSRH